METENRCELIANGQNKSLQQMQQNEKEKNEQMLTMQSDLNAARSENEALRKRMQKQSHAISKNLGKAEVLSDDVLILRKQLKSERKLSKMYVDELQQIKMESKQQCNEEKQSKKIHKFYQKMLGSNMSEMRKEYEARAIGMKEEWERRVNEIEKRQKRESD